MNVPIHRASTFADFLAFLEERAVLTPEAVRRARNAHGLDRPSRRHRAVELGLTREAELARQLSRLPRPSRGRARAGEPRPRADRRRRDRLRRANQVLPLAALRRTRARRRRRPLRHGRRSTRSSYQFDRPAEIRICAAQRDRRGDPRARRGRRRVVRAARPTPRERHRRHRAAPRLRPRGADHPVRRRRSSSRRSIAAPPTSTSSRGATTSRIRFRCDGMLDVVDTAPRAMHAGIATRIKILARLNIAERRLPQDGRMRVGGARPGDRPARLGPAERARRDLRAAHPRPVRRRAQPRRPRLRPARHRRGSARSRTCRTASS